MTDITAPATLSQNTLEGTNTLSTEICDRRFINQLNQLRTLKEFLFEEKVAFASANIDGIDLGVLNNLRYKHTGRVPENFEWRLLDIKLDALTSYLNVDLRRKIRIRELGIFFGELPLVFLSCSIIATVAFVMLGRVGDSESVVAAFIWLVTMIIWAISQGGLGACAFLGTNVILKIPNLAALQKSPKKTKLLT